MSPRTAVLLLALIEGTKAGQCRVAKPNQRTFWSTTTIERGEAHRAPLLEGKVRSGGFEPLLVEVFPAKTFDSPPKTAAASRRRVWACWTDETGEFTKALRRGLYEVRISGQHHSTWRLRLQIIPRSERRPLELAIGPPI